jgi:hypothetical protein
MQHSAEEYRRRKWLRIGWYLVGDIATVVARNLATVTWLYSI